MGQTWATDSDPAQNDDENPFPISPVLRHDTAHRLTSNALTLGSPSAAPRAWSASGSAIPKSSNSRCLICSLRDRQPQSPGNSVIRGFGLTVMVLWRRRGRHPPPGGSGTGSRLLHYFSTNRVDSRGLSWIPVDSMAANKRLTSNVLDHKLRVVSQLPKHG